MAGRGFNPLSFFFLVAIIVMGLYGNTLREGWLAIQADVPDDRPTTGESPAATRPVHVDPVTAPSQGAPSSRMLAGTVERIVDGDTLDLRADGRLVRIRLAGIDAPEIDQPFGSTARDFLAQLTLGRTVHGIVLELDRNGRSIADLYLRDYWVNGYLVQMGLAWHFTRYDNFQELTDLEEAARRAQRGLWVDPRPIPPWEWRRR